MIYLGQRLDAETAEDEGLFGEVVPDEEIDDRAAELAAELAEKPAFSLRGGQTGDRTGVQRFRGTRLRETGVRRPVRDAGPA